ncbi:MAG: hypothetical protein PVJ75_07115, partial [Chloroflexota bacterium]
SLQSLQAAANPVEIMAFGWRKSSLSWPIAARRPGVIEIGWQMSKFVASVMIQATLRPKRF